MVPHPASLLQTQPVLGSAWQSVAAQTPVLADRSGRSTTPKHIAYADCEVEELEYFWMVLKIFWITNGDDVDGDGGEVMVVQATNRT